MPPSSRSGSRLLYAWLTALTMTGATGCPTLRDRAEVTDAAGAEAASDAVVGMDVGEPDALAGTDGSDDASDDAGLPPDGPPPDGPPLDVVSDTSPPDVAPATVDAPDGSMLDAGRDASDDIAIDRPGDVAGDLAPPTCRDAEVLCGAACVDPASSVEHCGGCGAACPPGALACSLGRCVVARRLAANQNGTCAVLSTGSVWCWGGAIVTVRGTREPTVVPGLVDVDQVALGTEHLCARLNDGTVRCVGANGGGQSGVPAPASTEPWNFPSTVFVPVAVRGLTDVVQVAAGEEHSCARLRDGTVRCWGRNDQGQLGVARAAPGDPSATATPVEVVGVDHAADLAAVAQYTCVIRDDGAVRCWGTDITVDGVPPILFPAAAVTTLLSGARLSTGLFRSLCAFGDSGALTCWGSNTFGELGRGTASGSLPPGPVSGLSNVASASAGSSRACAATTTGAVSCWGDGARGLLGDGMLSSQTRPVRVLGVSDAAEVVVGGSHACARLRDATIRCWGDNYLRQLGVGSLNLPEAVPGLTGVVSHCSAGSFACAVLSAGRVRCWGDNAQGQLGLGTTNARLSPTEVPGITDATKVSCAGSTTCALLRTGALLCWGYNVNGNAVPGMTGSIPTPTEVIAAGVRDVTVGTAHTCAIRDTGSLQCWGNNASYQLGDGTRSVRTAPVTVGGLADVRGVEAGFGFTCALDGAGSVYCWGSGSDALGVVGVSTLPTPTALPGITGATALRCGGAHCCATVPSASPWCWGRNDSGQRGLADRSVAARPPARSPVFAFDVPAMVGSTTYLLRADGSVYFVGADLADLGSIGFNGTATPVELPGVSDAVAIEGQCARRADGTLVCWGDNAFGQHGTGHVATEVATTRLR